MSLQEGRSGNQALWHGSKAFHWLFVIAHVTLAGSAHVTSTPCPHLRDSFSSLDCIRGNPSQTLGHRSHCLEATGSFRCGRGLGLWQRAASIKSSHAKGVPITVDQTMSYNRDKAVWGPVHGATVSVLIFPGDVSLVPPRHSLEIPN